MDGQTDESPLHKRSSFLLTKELLTRIPLRPHKNKLAGELYITPTRCHTENTSNVG